MQPPPPVTRALLIAIFAVFILQQVLPSNFIAYLALFPVQSGLFWPWQVLTYPFLHSDLASTFFNLLALFMFGAELELLWGARRYIQFLGASTLTAAVVYLVLALAMPAPAFISAAGAIFGLLLAFGLLFPRRPILFFFVYPTNMRTAVILFGGLELVFIVFQRGVGAAINIAHLGGMLGGYLVILWWRRRPPRFRRVK
jgi:membrane associated rhomboid family serine protease